MLSLRRQEVSKRNLRNRSAIAPMALRGRVALRPLDVVGRLVIVVLSDCANTSDDQRLLRVTG